MRFEIVLRYIGIVLLFNAIFLFISTLISFGLGENSLLPLLYSTLICVLFGLFPLIFVPEPSSVNNREGFLIITLSWLISCLTGVIPYVLWGGEFNFTNAWFESVSGFTTTGSTILNDIEALPKGLLFWRSSTHWIGGIGIVIFVLAVMPAFQRSKHVLYKKEISSLAMDNFRYRSQKTLQVIIVVYLSLTFLETILLMIFGMSFFDAINHTFATVATGGFSVRNLSIAYYDSVAIEIIIIFFMILSGIHFGLLFVTFTQDPARIFKTTVVRFYLLVLVVGSLLAATNIYSAGNIDFATAFRQAAFQVVSLGTTTGFATADANLWPVFAQLLLVFFTFQCACAGSTSGGIKVDRVLIFLKVIRRHVTQIFHPNIVRVIKIDKQQVDEQGVDASIIFIILYISVVFVSTALLAAMNVDLISALTASAATMGNVGPGLGMVGTMNNFSLIPEAGKWVLSFTMLFGRLEIFGLIMIFLPKAWHRY
jgi:trk system potassium uptake protein TrkH